MILAADIGNTFITIGCVEGIDPVVSFRLKSDPYRTSLEYLVLLREMLEMEGLSPDAFDGAIISSVALTLTAEIRKALARLIGKEPIIVGAGLKTGLNIRIDNPAQLGSDLAVGAVGAIGRYAAPIIIVDLGTATTFTVVDGQQRLRGGAILPGARLSLEALSDRAEQLPKIPLEAPKSCICANTVDCMKSGAVFGAAAAIDGMIERIEAELGEKATVVSTGALADAIVPYCRREMVSDPDLLMRGLALIYSKNTK